MNCLHSTQKRIGTVDGMWCLYCGSIKLGNGEWQKPAILAKSEPDIQPTEDKDTPT
jgi:hypothetical protein